MKFILCCVTSDLSDNLTEMCIVRNSSVRRVASARSAVLSCGRTTVLSWPEGYPRKDMGSVEVLWNGGRLPLPERTWDQWKYYGMEIGYLPQ